MGIELSTGVNGYIQKATLMTDIIIGLSIMALLIVGVDTACRHIEPHARAVQRKHRRDKKQAKDGTGMVADAGSRTDM